MIDEQPPVETVPEETPAANTYWAGKKGKHLAEEVMKRVDGFYARIKKNGDFDKFKKSYDAFYGQAFNSSSGDSSQILSEGEQGEYLNLNVNHYANFLRHQTNLVLSEKPGYKPVAASTNSEAISQAVQAQPVIDSLHAKLEMDRLDRDWVLKAIMGQISYKRYEWDSAAGYDYNGTPSGDIGVSVLTMVDVARGNSRASQKGWLIPRTFRNKHDLAAKYPEHAKRILALEAPNNGGEGVDRYLDVGDQDDADEDEIAVFELFHERSPALPKGKYAVVLDDDLVLLEVDLPYEYVPIYSLTPEDKVKSATGHTLAYDLLSVQEAVNRLYSIILTNQATFGHQNILCPEDANVSVEQLAGGLNFIKYRANQWGLKPEALNLTATPAEIFNFLKQLEMAMETISGVNAASRGNAPQNLESGAALAQLDAQAKSFASGLMQSFTTNSERATTGLIQIVKRFAQLPQKLALAGEDQTYRIEEFSAKTFSFVDSVRAERVSSVMQSTAGKLEVANKLLDGGHINANQYMTVATTGQLAAMTDAAMKERLHIKRNIEKWRRGEMVPEAVITENHALHIKEESAPLFDDELRADPNKVAGIVEHLKYHITLLAHPDPIMQNLLMVLGQQPLMMPPPPPPGGPNPEGSQPKPPGQEPSSAGPAQPGLPELPTNPSTGEQWDPVSGGGAVPVPQ